MTRMSTNGDAVLRTVSRALGRDRVPARVPDPPVVDEAVARFFGQRRDDAAAGAPASSEQPAAPVGGADVVDEFIRVATEMARMQVREVARDRVAQEVAAVLRERQARRVVSTRTGLPAELDLTARLSAEGFEACWWSDTTLDATYEADAGVTDVWFAVAETGSLVIRASAEHGRAVSLVPPLHIAIVEPSQVVPDLIDAMGKIAAEGAGSATVFITGPSKTSDIEMTLVTGVHGPMEVVVLLVASIE